MEREEIIKRIDAITDRVASIDKEREGLVKELHDILPIKKGDKVSICNREGDEHVRFAFVNEIKIHTTQIKREAKIEFDLQKCKADGTISQHADYLKYGEYITKIK